VTVKVWPGFARQALELRHHGARYRHQSWRLVCGIGRVAVHQDQPVVADPASSPRWPARPWPSRRENVEPVAAGVDPEGVMQEMWPLFAVTKVTRTIEFHLLCPWQLT
jgi:hypothetical protein